MTHDATLTQSRRRALSLAIAASLMASLSPGLASQASAAVAAPVTALPQSLPFADSAFESIWTRNDQPVASGAAQRSWTWGPAPLVSGTEAYAEATDGSGKRLVQYFDKARMEINNPRLAPSSNSFATNGLLTVELISGRMQVGNSKFETRRPAGINIASDPDDGNAPTYSSFGTVANTSAGEHRQPDKSANGYATQRINRQGQVSDDPSKQLPETRIAYYEKATGHNVPKVFLDFLTSTGPVRSGVVNVNKPLLDPWVFAMGLPIGDAYWANVKIEGKLQDVLIQPFERRVLTYVPTLAPQWRVQMGNIGQHYLQWRYEGTSSGPQKLVKGTPSYPAYLTIPSLGVQAKVEHVGVDKQNNMAIPNDPNNAAWFKPGTIPGNVGNAVMDGHLDWYGIPQAIFYHLDTLKPGARVYVRDDKGVDRAFVVTSQLLCIYNKCPLLDVYGKTNLTRLNLITCAGVFNRAQQNYDKRLVVYSELVP
jgi:sortase (surface protein transpeptidase)